MIIWGVNMIFALVFAAYYMLDTTYQSWQFR